MLSRTGAAEPGMSEDFRHNLGREMRAGSGGLRSDPTFNVSLPRHNFAAESGNVRNPVFVPQTPESVSNGS